MPAFPIRARPRLLAAALVVAALALLAPASALAVEDKTQFSVIAGSLAFSANPAMPTLSSVTLNGEAQKTNTTMTNFAVTDATGSGSGWKVTVEGQSGTGKSAVFAQYCGKPTKCGTDPEGYVTGGATLPADSLTLSSTGASFAAEKSSTGTAPELKCNPTACNVDSATPVKIASAAEKAGMGTFGTTGWSSSSLTLSTPSNLKALSNEEVYRVNLLWTLGTGP
jgi:putative surface cell wall-binding protein